MLHAASGSTFSSQHRGMFPSTGQGSDLYSSKFPRGGSRGMQKAFIGQSEDLSQVLIVKLEHVSGEAKMEQTLSQPSGSLNRNWSDRWAVCSTQGLWCAASQRNLVPRCWVRQHELLLPSLSESPSGTREKAGKLEDQRGEGGERQVRTKSWIAHPCLQESQAFPREEGAGKRKSVGLCPLPTPHALII